MQIFKMNSKICSLEHIIWTTLFESLQFGDVNTPYLLKYDCVDCVCLHISSALIGNIKLQKKNVGAGNLTYYVQLTINFLFPESEVNFFIFWPDIYCCCASGHAICERTGMYSSDLIFLSFTFLLLSFVSHILCCSIFLYKLISACCELNYSMRP